MQCFPVYGRNTVAYACTKFLFARLPLIAAVKSDCLTLTRNNTEHSFLCLYPTKRYYNLQKQIPRISKNIIVATT